MTSLTFSSLKARDKDLVHVVRKPSETCPLGLKDSDNTCISSAANFSISKTLQAIIIAIQRGLIKGRNFLGNILELDSAGRLLGYPHFLKQFPIFAFFDFLSAFPSVLHDSIHSLLHIQGQPVGCVSMFAFCTIGFVPLSFPPEAPKKSVFFVVVLFKVVLSTGRSSLLCRMLVFRNCRQSWPTPFQESDAARTISDRPLHASPILKGWSRRSS